MRVWCCIVVAALMTGCSSVPERYAFWRDDTMGTYSGVKPNLADVPAAPDVTSIKAEMNEARQRLESDRSQAYQKTNDQ